MFEKLEFYLNLKNDFALTFIQDARSFFLSSLVFFWNPP